MKPKFWSIILYCLLVSLLIAAPVSASKRAPELEPQLRSKASAFNGTVGIYIKDLTTGQEVHINDNQVFPTASTSKLIVAMAAYKYTDYIPAQARPNMPGLVASMITRSDNDAFATLADQLGSRVLERTCSDLGLRSTAIHNDAAHQKTGFHSITTARDMGKALEQLLDGRYIGDRNSKTVLRLMEHGIYNEEIPRLLPASTPVAHKPGELYNIVCDVGIVFNAKRPYLISVYTRSDAGNGNSSDFIAGIAATTDKYFSSLSARSLPRSLRKNIP